VDMRRVRNARVGRFKPLADFDWSWPRAIDRAQVEDLFELPFLDPDDPWNLVLTGPNGVGKSMIAQNLAHRALLCGHTVRFTSASEMLNDLVAQTSAGLLAQRLSAYTRPRLLVIDEVGYLSYDTRHADLLFEVINRRSDRPKSTIITTNRAFKDWDQVFPNATCVVALVDRLTQRSEIVKIDGDSYRKKEAEEREARRAVERAALRTARRVKTR
jgi:DNA replication protein DnaC